MKTDDSSTQLSLRRPETGAVLVVVLLAMIALLGMGLTGLYLTSGSIQMSANINMRNQALYVAEAGIQAAKNLLNQPLPVNLNSLLAGNSPLTLSPVALPSGVSDEPLSDPLNGCLGRDASGPKRGAILRDEPNLGCRTDTSAYADCNYPTTIAHDEAPPDPNTMSPAPTQFMGKYTLFIRQDLAECRQGHFTQDTNGIVVIRSEGTASDNRTKVVIEATMSPNPVATLLPPTIAQTCTAGAAGCDDNSSVQQGITVAGNGNLTPPSGGTTGGGGTTGTGGTGTGTGTGTGGGGGTGTGTGTGTGGTTSGNSTGCTPPKIQCGGVCVTPNTNPNCGTCGTSCTSDQACCASGSTWTCDSIKTDNNNCGTCGTKCGTGQTCCNGTCCASCCNNACCASGTCCNNICCTSGQSCSSNHCCPTGQPWCGSGSSGACCASGTVCAVSGSTSQCCPTATPNLCGATCVNATTDPNNCGPLCTKCATGSLCCNGSCVDPHTSHSNCGSCGNTCSSIRSCSSATCLPCLKYAVRANTTCIGIETGTTITGSIAMHDSSSNPCLNHCPGCVSGQTTYNYYAQDPYTATTLPEPPCNGSKKADPGGSGSVTLYSTPNSTASATCYTWLTISNYKVTLTAGSYVVDATTWNSTPAQLYIDDSLGPVYLWIRKTAYGFNINSPVIVKSGNPNNFWLIYDGTSAVTHNSASDPFTGVIFVPQVAPFMINFTITGAVVGGEVHLNGGGKVTYDSRLCAQ